MYTKRTSDLNDIVGQRFGKLVALELMPRARSPKGCLIPTKAGYPEPPKYRCQCDCGNETIVNRTSLLTGCTKSCGCIRKNTSKSILKIFANREGNLSRVGCKLKHRSCGKYTCCWECVDYEKCDKSCIENPTQCGQYRGGK